MRLAVLPIKAASMSIMDSNNEIRFWSLDLQDLKSLTLCWRSVSELGHKGVSPVFEYEGSLYNSNSQWYPEVNILQLTVGYLNATINRKTRNAEPDIGTDGSSQTRQNPQVDWYGSRLGLPRLSGSGFWMVLELNRPVFAGQTWTAGRSPGPVANTSQCCSVVFQPAKSEPDYLECLYSPVQHHPALLNYIW